VPVSFNDSSLTKMSNFTERTKPFKIFIESCQPLLKRWRLQLAVNMHGGSVKINPDKVFTIVVDTSKLGSGILVGCKL